MAVKFTNNAATTLAAGINSSVTSISVTDGSVFPALTGSDHFYVTFDDTTNREIVKVTARSGNTLTVVRGQDNTTAQAFNSGDKAELRVVAALLEDITTEVTSTLSVDTFTGDGTTTAFTLSQAPSSEDNLIVFIEGAYQNPGDFVLSGTTLTLDEAPVVDRNIIVYHVKGAVSGNNLNQDSFTADGNTAAFTLSIAPIHENNTQVFIDGVYQQKNSYSVSGTTLTLDANPSNGATVEVMTFTQTDVNTLPASFVSGLTEVTAVGADHFMIFDATDSALKKSLVSDVLESATSISTSADATAITIDSSENVTFTNNVTINSGQLTAGGLAYPTSDGTNGQVLTTDGAGTLSFSTISGYTDSDVEAYLNTSEIYTDATNNRLGIGIASPSTELHVYSADQNALKIQTNTGINQIELANSTNSPTYITQDSYSLVFKADDNGWGGTASAIQFNVKNSERMTIDSSGVVHAKAGFGTTPVTSCSGFSGTAGYKYLIQPVGAMEPFWAVYSGDNYKSRGKGYFRWWYGYGNAATGTNQYRCEVDLVDKNLEFYEVMVEDMAGTTYAASAPAYEWAYWSTRQKFNTQSSNTNYATSSSMSGSIEAMWGQAGGHGLYNSVIGNACSWGGLQPSDAIGSGYTGNCGTYPSTTKGVPEPYYTDCSLRLGRPFVGSASFQESTGAFSYWFNF